MDNSVILERIAELKASLGAGEEELKMLDTKRRELQIRQTRISGAIAVLEEIAAEQGITTTT